MAVTYAWEPTERYIARSRLRAFAKRQGFNDYDAFLQWSVEDPDAFWRATEADLGIRWSHPYARVMDTSGGVPWTTWWTGGRMNYVATALGHDPARIHGASFSTPPIPRWSRRSAAREKRRSSFRARHIFHSGSPLASKRSSATPVTLDLAF